MTFQTGPVRVLYGTCASPKERFHITETQNTRTNRGILSRYEFGTGELTLRPSFDSSFEL